MQPRYSHLGDADSSPHPYDNCNADHDASRVTRRRVPIDSYRGIEPRSSTIKTNVGSRIEKPRMEIGAGMDSAIFHRKVWEYDSPIFIYMKRNVG